MALIFDYVLQIKSHIVFEMKILSARRKLKYQDIHRTKMYLLKERNSFFFSKCYQQTLKAY